VTGVFISHASADKELVDEFVDTIIRLGCGLKSEEIFYSSGEDTGVPSGYDLLSYVRERVGDAGLVVAVISPTFQTRPVCVAELGAAWGVVGNLLPILVPGVARSDLEGVLVGLLAKYLDDGSVLDEVHDRVGEAVGYSSSAATWGRFRAKWLANVERLAKCVPTPRHVVPAELERVEHELVGTREALTDSESERAELEGQIEQLSKAKSADDVRQIRLPKDEIRRFEALRDRAAKTLRALDDIVAECVWYQMTSGSMPWPNAFEDQYRAPQAQEALNNGYLDLDSDEQLVPNEEFPDVEAARKAVRELQKMLRGDHSERFVDWFREEYRGPMNLTKRAVWDAIFR
jgi:TIR domain